MDPIRDLIETGEALLRGDLSKLPKRAPVDAAVLPLFAMISGVELPSDEIELVPGITLRKTYVDMFGVGMLALKPPPAAGAPHPAPWIALEGSYDHKCRVEIAVTDLTGFPNLKPTQVLWLLACVLRLQVSTPVRIVAISNESAAQMLAAPDGRSARRFEEAPAQFGVFRGRHHTLLEADVYWARGGLQIAASLLRDERFSRALAIFDQAHWVPTAELSVTMIWTAIEILFGLSGARDKTRAICRALADYVAESPADRDRAFPVIRAMYEKRGSVVHAGGEIDANDFAQSFRFGQVAFRRVLIDAALPVPP